MPKIDINGIVRDMTEKEIAAYEKSDAQAPYCDTRFHEQSVEELRALLAEITLKISQISGEPFSDAG